MSRIFLHTLSFPEHLWLDFFRAFFAQETLISDDQGQKLVNNFRYDQSQDDANKAFDILLENDLKTNNPNIIPCLVLEDLGMATLGVAINRLEHWSVRPETTKTRTDLMRVTYVFHCCAKDRGESRLLAAIVSNAITVFYDQLLEAGFHKIEPWSIGKSIPIKSDVLEFYVDTPVQVTFECQQTWKTIEDGVLAKLDGLRIVIVSDSTTRYLATSMSLCNPHGLDYIATSMRLDPTNISEFIGTQSELIDPESLQDYFLSRINVVNPLTRDSFVRTSMRVR